MAEAPSIRESVVRLLTNWGKGTVSARMIDQWVEVLESDGYSPEDVRAGVDRCIRSWPDRFAPQGVASVLPYMPGRPAARPRSSLPYWGRDGDWGGDWGGVPARRWLLVAATFLGEARPRRVTVRTETGAEAERVELRDTMDGATRRRVEEFLVLARRRVSQAAIEAGADAYARGHLGRFLAEWSGGEALPCDSGALGGRP